MSRWLGWKRSNAGAEGAGSEYHIQQAKFGSTALGEDTERSDIDIGIDCAGGLEDEDFLSLKEDLNLYVDTPRRIDLVELRRLPLDFLEFALRGAVIWHVGKDCLKNWLKQEGLKKS